MLKVFVYGTLKKKQGNHHFLDGAKFLGTGRTKQSNFSLYNLGYYPGLQLEGNTTVRGEIYEVDDLTHKQLRRLEGYPSLYREEEVEIILEETVDNKTVETDIVATTYIYNYETNPKNLIETGSW